MTPSSSVSSVAASASAASTASRAATSAAMPNSHAAAPAAPTGLGAPQFQSPGRPPFAHHSPRQRSVPLWMHQGAALLQQNWGTVAAVTIASAAYLIQGSGHEGITYATTPAFVSGLFGFLRNLRLRPTSQVLPAAPVSEMPPVVDASVASPSTVITGFPRLAPAPRVTPQPNAPAHQMQVWWRDWATSAGVALVSVDRVPNLTSVDSFRVPVPAEGPEVKLSVGRGPQNELNIANSHISRHHLTLTWNPQNRTLVIQDEGSHNGTSAIVGEENVDVLRIIGTFNGESRLIQLDGQPETITILLATSAAIVLKIPARSREPVVELLQEDPPLDTP